MRLHEIMATGAQRQVASGDPAPARTEAAKPKGTIKPKPPISTPIAKQMDREKKAAGRKEAAREKLGVEADAPSHELVVALRDVLDD